MSITPGAHVDSRRAPRKIKGVPDLVVEILSPSSVDRDQGLKRELYQKVGVPEYRVVDPSDYLPSDQVIEQYVLKDGVYQLKGRHSDAIAFGQLEGVTVDLTRVW